MFDYSPPTGRTADTAGATPSVSPSPDPAEDSRRRYALQYLEQFSYPVELGTLAAYVVAAERNVPVDAVSDNACERIAIRLHHVDIPKLAAEGQIDYDPESRMVLYTGREDCERYTAIGTRSRHSDPA